MGFGGISLWQLTIICFFILLYWLVRKTFKKSHKKEPPQIPDATFSSTEVPEVSEPPQEAEPPAQEKKKIKLKYLQVSDDLVEAFVIKGVHDLKAVMEEYGVSDKDKLNDGAFIFLVTLGFLAIHNSEFSENQRATLQSAFLMNANTHRLDLKNLIPTVSDKAEVLSDVAVNGKGASEFVRLAIHFLGQFGFSMVDSEHLDILLRVTGIITACMKPNIDFLNNLSKDHELVA